MKKIQAYKVLSDETLKGETKADLIERIRILEHNWSATEESYNNAVKNSEKIFAEQKAEIEQLTERVRIKTNEADWRGDHLQYMDEREATLEKQNAELQKQVDELTADRDKWRAKANELTLCQGQTVKDTAKEILQAVGNLFDDGDQRFRLKDYQWHKDLCKRFGVEVE